MGNSGHCPRGYVLWIVRDSLPEDIQGAKVLPSIQQAPSPRQAVVRPIWPFSGHKGSNPHGHDEENGYENSEDRTPHRYIIPHFLRLSQNCHDVHAKPNPACVVGRRWLKHFFNTKTRRTRRKAKLMTKLVVVFFVSSCSKSEPGGAT